MKGYHLWCLEQGFKKRIINRDVVFKEKEMVYKPKVSEYVTIESMGDENAKIEVESSKQDKSEATKSYDTFENDRRLIDASEHDRGSTMFDEEHCLDDD